MLGTLVAAGFGLGLFGNPPRRKRRTVIDPITGRRVSVKSVKVKMGGSVKRRSVRGYRAMIKGSDGVWRMNPRRRNPETEVRELVLYITNDGDLYRQMAQPIIKNLRKKIAKGKYDAAKAVKAWAYLANAGAQKYTKEHGTPGPNGSYGAFSAADRREVAKELAESYEEELNSTNPRHRRRNPRGTRDLETRNYTIGGNYVDITTWRNASATAFITVTVRGPGGVKSWEAKSQGPSAGGYHKPTQAAESVYKKITGSFGSFGGGESMYKEVAEAAATKNNPRRRKRH